MVVSTTSVDFWRYSVLFTKVVDGRFALWSREPGPDRPLCEAFYPTIEAEIQNRIKHWNDMRRDKLFGDKPPEWVFLAQVVA